MKKHYVTLLPGDYKIWCNGVFVAIWDAWDGHLVFYGGTSQSEAKGKSKTFIRVEK